MTSASQSFTTWLQSWSPPSAAPGLSGDWKAAQSEVELFAKANVREIDAAESAWVEGQSVFLADFENLAMPGILLKGMGISGALSIWGHATSCIVDIGWELHSWSHSKAPEELTATAVFVRPRAMK